MVPRLRDTRILSPLAAGALFTQPGDHSLADPYRVDRFYPRKVNYPTYCLVNSLLKLKHNAVIELWY